MQRYAQIYASRTQPQGRAQQYQASSEFYQSSTSQRAITPRQLRKLQREQERNARELDSLAAGYEPRTQRRGIFSPCYGPPRPEFDYYYEAQEKQDFADSRRMQSERGVHERYEDHYIQDLADPYRGELDASTKRLLTGSPSQYDAYATSHMFYRSSPQIALYNAPGQADAEYYSTAVGSAAESAPIPYSRDTEMLALSAPPGKHTYRLKQVSVVAYSRPACSTSDSCVYTATQYEPSSSHSDSSDHFSVNPTDKKYKQYLRDLEDSVRRSLILQERISPSKTMQLSVFVLQPAQGPRKSLYEQADEIHNNLVNTYYKDAKNTDISAQPASSAPDVFRRARELDGRSCTKPSIRQRENISDDYTTADYYSFDETGDGRLRIDALTRYEIEVIQRMRASQQQDGAPPHK